MWWRGMYCCNKMETTEKREREGYKQKQTGSKEVNKKLNGKERAMTERMMAKGTGEIEY